ncbi:MAG: alpha/beta hydrolase-fold protein, partial [Bacteroidota bacterium]
HRFQMTSIESGRYYFAFPADFPFSRPIEYKYVRGDWDEVEVDPYGNKTPNRQIRKSSGLIKDEVPRWSTNGATHDPKLLPNIKVISEHFKIPQLIKTRRITALLPHDYYQTNQRYPVLYLQDGQNLFDENAPFGNWGVTKKLALLSEEDMGNIIIIAIDHAEEERIKEFTPVSHNMQKGSAEGRKYVRFLAQTLKPYIDQHFRTQPEAHNTGIGGSSMGGLISIYAGLMFPHVFSKLMIFSPSLWVNPHISFNAIKSVKSFNTQIYLYAGAKESTTMIPNAQRFQQTVQKKAPRGSKIEFKWSIDPEGTHSEYHWGMEFPKAIEWLFFKSSS